MDLLCSDSDSDATIMEMPPSPATSLHKPDDKPKPSAAPHLRPSARAPQPTEESLSLFRMDFAYQIDFDFCKHVVQDFASSPSSSKPSLGPPTRACAKLLVRSGLHCRWCFRLKSECLCLETQTQAPPSPVKQPAFWSSGASPRFSWGRPLAFESVSLYFAFMTLTLRHLLLVLPLQVLRRYWEMTSGSSLRKMKPRRWPAQKASAPASADQASDIATLSHGYLSISALGTCILQASLPL